MLNHLCWVLKCLCPAINECTEVTGHAHTRLPLFIAYRPYMRGVHLKRKLKYTAKAGVLASWLLHCVWYVRQYFSECYNRDVQVHIEPQKLNHKNFCLKRSLRFFGYMIFLVIAVLESLWIIQICCLIHRRVWLAQRPK